VREKLDTNGKLINFMDGLTRQADLKTRPLQSTKAAQVPLPTRRIYILF